MSNFLLYILKSTLCISLFYLLFRTVMREEVFFALNRMLLLTIVVTSAVIPLLYLPQVIRPPVQVGLQSAFAPVETRTATLPMMEPGKGAEISASEKPIPETVNRETVFTLQQLLQYLYLAGFFITLLILVHGLATLFFLLRRAKSVKMDGSRLLVIDREIAAFSFGRFVILSQKDYEEHHLAMFAHEQAHIRLNHFYDLILLETVKIFHWFNPVIYWLIQDMKEIHEFQSDGYTLAKGIDATQYQLLIIQKGVGSQRFALANSFNHCQIKKRIVMMNKQKTGKAWSWKVAAFLPLLAMLLMAFGREGDTSPSEPLTLTSLRQVIANDTVRQVQNNIIKGKVLDGQGKAIPSVGVTIAGTPIVAITGRDGGFILKGVPNDAEVTFARYDFISLKLKSDFQNEMIVRMMKSEIRLNGIKAIGNLNGDNQKNPATNEPEKYWSVKENPPLFLLDGVEIDKYAMDALNKKEIAHTWRMYGEKAIKAYGEKAKNGVVLMTSKKKQNKDLEKNKLEIAENANKSSFTSNPPLILFDGVEIDENRLKILEKTDGIGSICILKNRNVYGEKGKNGVIIYTSKEFYNEQRSSNSQVYGVVETEPEFPGGQESMKAWLQEKVKYPSEAIKDQVIGNVFVSFIVNDKGKIVEPKVQYPLHPLLDAEALRVISSMPDWKPSTQYGKAVDFKVIIPIRFALQ